MYSKASYAHSLLDFNAKHLSRCISAKREKRPLLRADDLHRVYVAWNYSDFSAGTMLCITLL